jgi:hypothetical protein
MRTKARHHHFKHRVPDLARIVAIQHRIGKSPAHQDGAGAARTSSSTSAPFSTRAAS